MKNYCLGIDIGGTKIKGILLDKLNRHFFGFNIVTPRTKGKFLKILTRELTELIQKKKISGIGVGLPGIVNLKRRNLVKAPNLPFLRNWPADKFFLKFSKKVRIDNDSRCFLIAEAFLGAGRGYNNIIALTVGTGIGGGIMINGKIYYGRNFGAGEFGHTIMQIQNLKFKVKSYTLEQLGAKKAFLKTDNRSKIIGIGVANLINAFDPEIIILGGGEITSGNIKIETVRKIAKKYTLSPLSKKTKIIKGKLSDDAQAIGAALLLRLKLKCPSF